MGNKNRKTLFWTVFVLALLGVIWGWLLVIQRMIQNDAKVAEARVREVEEEYLAGIPMDLSQMDLEVFDTDQALLELVTDDSVSGVWFEESHYRPKKPGGLKPWPVDEVVSSVELHDQFEEFSWGHIEDGRDRLASLLLKFARKEKNHFVGREFLAEGLINSYSEGYGLSPGFRLLMISELSDGWNTAMARRLKLAEQIRAVEGKVDELGIPLETFEEDGVTVFLSRAQLLRQYQGESSPELDLSSKPPEGRSWIRVAGLKHWPYLSLKNRLPDGSAGLAGSELTVRYLGYLTMISTLAVIGAAIWMGGRELKKARERTDLAASVAHELRTPLAGQRVILESLKKRGEYDEEYLSMALRENERLGDLAEEFLTFSRLERGVLEVQLKQFNLSKVIEPLVGGLSEEMREVVCCKIDQAKATVMADEAAVATIVRNLIENAWKYSDEPREISISAVSNETEVGFEVTDNGIGLSKADRKRIFRHFYRVDQRLSRSREGLGIGLSIVRRLVDAMEGRMEVESELGKGSTFTVYLKKGGVA